MESSSAPLTPGKNRKPCPSCSPVKYEGGTTYVCSSPVVIVQQMLPKAGHSSQRRIDVEYTPGETKETAGISDDLQNKSKKSSKRGRPKLALRKGTKGIATMPPKLSSLSQPGNILNAVDLNESDDFRPSITTRSNKRRKLSDTDKAKIKIPYSDEVFSEASRSKKAGSDLTGSRNGKSQIGSSEISGLEPTRSKKASAEGESLDVPISRKERSRIGSSEIESSAIPLKVASLEIGCNSLEAGTPGLATNQVCGTESEWDVDGVHNSAKVTVELEPPLAKGDESTEEMKSCVICRQSVKSDNLQSHQRACLNRHFTRGANPADASAGVSDEVLARALQQTELMQSSPPLELVLCQICNLDLSGLNAHRQTQHVNTCMDKKETAVTVAVADSEAMERARKAVLDCPMCGKPLKTEASRKSHMNRCSKSCNVGQDHLSQLIEQQRREHEARLTAGQIPLTTRAQKTKNRGQSAKTKRTTKALDEDTQFALALSTSLVEEQQKQETQLLDQLESIDRLALGCKKLDKDIKKGRRKKGNSHIGEELPLLLKYTTEEIRKKIAERVAMVVTPGDSNHFDNTPPMSESDVTKRFSKNTDRQQSVFNGTERTNLSLWKKSCMNSDTADIYYVKELSPLVKVSTAHFDRLLAKMSALAGTGKTDKNSGNLSKVEDTEIGDEASSVDFVSTQTAVVLAELAAEEDESVLQSSPKCTSQNLTRISSSQSTADRDCKNQTSTSLVKSFNHASKKSQISKSAPGKNACSLDIEGATCLSELHSSGVEEVVKLGGDNYANGSDNNTSEEPEEEATSRADNCGVAAQEGNSWGNESGNEFFDSKKTSFSFDASGFCPEDKSKVDPTIITQSLQSQLSFLVNNPIFSDIRLLTGDQKVVHAHRVILAARCPRLIQDLQQTSEDLHLEEFTCRAVLNVIKFIYAGEIVISRNCEEEIQLAQRFGVEELCDILQHRVGDKWEPNADADEDKTLEKEQVLDDLLNSLFDGSMGTVVQETNSENLEEGKDEEEMDSLYQFMSTQREKSSANKGDNSKKGQEYLGCTSIKQIGSHSAGQEIKVNKGVVLSLSSDISRPGIQRITEPLGKPNMKRLEEIVGDISCGSHTGSSEQCANQSSHSHRPEKDIYEYKAVEQSVTSNDDNEIEENKCRNRSSGCSAESDMGRGLKRVIVSHCDEDGAMETVCKRVKLDGPSSDGKSDLDLTSQVDLMDTSKSSSVTDLYNNDENHFDIVHSMLNELSPGEAEKYQPDWFKSSSSGSSEHAKSEKDDEDLKLQHDMNVGVAGDNLDEEERKSGDELIVIDVNAMEDINNEANSKLEDSLGSRFTHPVQDCSIESYPPLHMSVDSNITPEMLSSEENSCIRLGSESILANSRPRLTSTDNPMCNLKENCIENRFPKVTSTEGQGSNDPDGQRSKLNCTAGQRSEITTTLMENSSNNSLPEVAETEESKGNKDKESLHPTDVNEGDERQDATAADSDAAENNSDSWLIPDTPVKLPSLSGRSVLNEDRLKTFNSKSKKCQNKCSSVRKIDTNSTRNRQKLKLKNRRLNDSVDNLTPESFSPKNASVLENSGICDISKCQPSFSTAVVSTPVLQRAVKSFSRQSSVSDVLKKGLDLKDSADEILSFSKTMFSVINKEDHVETTVSGSHCVNGDGVETTTVSSSHCVVGDGVETTTVRGSHCVSGDSCIDEPGKHNKDNLNWQKLSENCTLSEARSHKMPIDVELTPEQRKELLKDVDNFFVRTPSEQRKNSVMSKLKKLSPRTSDVSVSPEINIHIESDGDDELPEVSEDQFSLLRKSSSFENVDRIELDPLPVEMDVDKPKNECTDIQIVSGNATHKHQQANGKKYTFKKIKLINNNEPILCIPEELPDIASPELLITQSQIGKPTEVQSPSVSNVSSILPLGCPAGQPETPADQCETSPNEGLGEGQREEFSPIRGPPDSDHAMSQGDADHKDPYSPVKYQDLDVWEDFDDAGVEFNPGTCDSFVDIEGKDHSVQNISLAKNEESHPNNSKMSGTALSPVELHSEPVAVSSSPELSLSSGDMAQPLAQSPLPSLAGTPPDLDAPPPQVDYLDQFEELQDHQSDWEPTSPSGSCSPFQNDDTRPSQPADMSFTKTPTCPPQASKKPKKKWVPPSPFTPMLDYDRMNTPGLKKEMQKFGIKPVSKKRMIVCLKDIYHQTHQYETDSEAEVSIVEVEEVATAMNTQEEEVMKEGKGAKQKSKAGKAMSNGHKTKPCAKGTKKLPQKGTMKGTTKQSQKGAVGKPAGVSTATELIDLSREEDDSEQGEESCGSDMVEESFFIESEMLSSQQESSPNLHEELHIFFTSNPELYSKVLMYEPLEFDWLREEIKNAGIKCSMPKLIHFMDERCITFTMKSRRADKPRGRRKKSVKKTTQSAVS